MLVFEQIAIASDHGGVNFKEQLKQHFRCIDFGTDNSDPVDYPDYAEKIAEYITRNEKAAGILICRTGVGMSIAANKFYNIRALLSDGNTDIARLSREHNNCNVICFGADFTELNSAVKCIDIFIHTRFLGGRHQNRLSKIK